MMRSCPRSEEVRDAVAAEDELSAGLAAHAAICTECAAAWAAARRFESGVDAAVNELVTDALPPTTVAAARGAPQAARPPWIGMALGALATTALAAFAAIGVLTVADLLSDPFGGRLGGAPASTDQTTTTVDCYLGNATVEVTVDSIGVEDAVSSVAYCIGDARDDKAIGDVRVITCALPPASHAPPGREDARHRAYLDACARVERVALESPAPGAEEVIPAPSRPFKSWEAAAEAVEWPILVPQWLPGGYELGALQGFGAPTEPDAIDSVVASYLRNGTLLSIEQFFIYEPDTFRIELTIPGDALGDVETGQTAVGTSPAFWAQGIVEYPMGGALLDVETLMLTWSDGELGYRITSRSDDLDALRRIGESLTGG